MHCTVVYVFYKKEYKQISISFNNSDSIESFLYFYTVAIVEWNIQTHDWLQ